MTPESSPSPSPLVSPHQPAESYQRVAAVHVPLDEWTEEDEELFSRQLEAAKKLSLQSSKGSLGVSGSGKKSDRMSTSEGRTYEELFLAAAAQWVQETADVEEGNQSDTETPHSKASHKQESDKS